MPLATMWHELCSINIEESTGHVPGGLLGHYGASMPEGLPRRMGHTTPAVAGAQQSMAGTVCLSDGACVGHHTAPQATRVAPSCRRGATGLPEEFLAASPGPHGCTG